MLLIPNTTNNWTKSRLFSPAHPGNQRSCLQENSVRCMLYETHAHIYNKCMPIAQDYVKFRGRRAQAHCLTKISCNFADLPDVRP